MPHTERASHHLSRAHGNLKSVLIVGVESTIGRGLLRAFEPTGISVWSTSRRSSSQSRHLLLDLSQSPDKWSLPMPPVDVAFLCAAVTSQAQCASEPEATHKVNVLNVFALAKKLTEAGTFVIFISSSLVLDGLTPYAKAGQSTNPQTIYGRQKAQAEQYLLGLGERVAVVRFGKVVAPGLPLFEDWAKNLRAGQKIHPFSDMVFAPVALPFAVEVLHKIALMQQPGIVQASAARDVSYAEAAQVIAKNVGADTALIAPVTRPQTADAFSPRHTTFDGEGLAKLHLAPPPPEQAFDHFSTTHFVHEANEVRGTSTKISTSSPIPTENKK